MQHMHMSTKAYTPEHGLSCAFRQWRATHSHCQYVHGYALGIKFTFAAIELDQRSWVADFGDLKDLKEWLVDTFDHKTVVAQDDPELEWFRKAHDMGILDLRVLPAVGCEQFAYQCFTQASTLIAEKYGSRVRVLSCEVSEHGSNSAIYSVPFATEGAQASLLKHNQD